MIAQRAGVASLMLVAAGCKGIPRAGERQARQDLQTVGQVYRPQGQKAALPLLSTNSGLSNFLAYALLNKPRVEAAYFDWVASVQGITVARSLPDPRLMFTTDIKEVVTALMPGLVQEFPGPGKLGARAAIASARSASGYFHFEEAVVQAAYDVKKAYYQLHFLEDTIRITEEVLGLLADLERIARAQNQVGKVTLQDVLRAQIEQDRVGTDLSNLEDSRRPLLAQLKAALGLKADQPDPPIPASFEFTPMDLSSQQLFAVALERNPRLRAMEAEVLMADAGLRLARKSRVPDFSLGVEVDVKTPPYMVRPQAGMTLPIWRDKIAAEIAGAQARKRAAEARLSNEQIMLAVDFADKTFSFRESTRNLELLRDRLIPKARKSLEVARAGYLSGQIDFFNLIDAERTLLNFQLAEVEVRTQRELVLAELSLLILGQPPAGAPVLPASNLPSTTNAPAGNPPATRAAKPSP